MQLTFLLGFSTLKLIKKKSNKCKLMSFIFFKKYPKLLIDEYTKYFKTKQNKKTQNITNGNFMGVQYRLFGCRGRDDNF